MQHVTYLQIAMTVVAAYGIHLIEPYNSKIKHKETTHTILIEFYKNLNEAFNNELGPEFFTFTTPHFPFREEVLQGVIKHTYGEEVVRKVKEVYLNYKDECLDLANHLRPAIQKLIARQRADYGFSETTAQFPVTEQTANIDEVPIHNLPMESYCGADAVYIEKLGTVEAASRRKLFKGTQHLVKDTVEPLSAHRPQLKKIKILKTQWKDTQNKLQQAGLDEKAAQMIQKEAFKHKLLRNLKADGGPFDSVEDIDNYMRTERSEKEKQKRLKMEVQYCRVTSSRLLQNDKLISSMKAGQGKRETLSTSEFSKKPEAILWKSF